MLAFVVSSRHHRRSWHFASIQKGLSIRSAAIQFLSGGRFFRASPKPTASVVAALRATTIPGKWVGLRWKSWVTPLPMTVLVNRLPGREAYQKSFDAPIHALRVFLANSQRLGKQIRMENSRRRIFAGDASVSPFKSAAWMPPLLGSLCRLMILVLIVEALAHW